MRCRRPVPPLSLLPWVAAGLLSSSVLDAVCVLLSAVWLASLSGDSFLWRARVLSIVMLSLPSLGTYMLLLSKCPPSLSVRTPVVVFSPTRVLLLLTLSNRGDGLIDASEDFAARDGLFSGSGGGCWRSGLGGLVAGKRVVDERLPVKS